jgi:hypothetical protein
MSGNPAQNLILTNSKEKVEKGEELTEVEKIILREYVVFLRSKLNKLQLKSQKQMLSDTEYAQMQGLESEICKYGGA